MSSILTNKSSMVALESLRSINRSLEANQAEISSGRRVGSSRDNSAVWAISSAMSADTASFRTISESLSLGAATVGVARSVSEKVVGVLQDMKALIVQSQNEATDQAKFQADLTERTGLIATYVASAQFNGLNLLDGSSPAPLNVLAALGRDTAGVISASYVSVDRQDLSTTAGGGLASLTSLDLDDPATALADIEAALDTAINAAAGFGSAQVRMEKQGEFISSLVDSMNTGIGALTDADLEEASVRLQALQVQQQLGVQSLSIANEAPRAVLALLR